MQGFLKICREKWRSVCYIKSRYIMSSFLIIIAFFLYILQIAGLESFIKFLITSPQCKIQITDESKWLLSIIVPLLGDFIVFSPWGTFLYRNQWTTISLVKKFLQASLADNGLSWLYVIKFAIVMLTQRDRVCIWVTAQRYMKMHVAAAILARRYYYSLYKAPDHIWKVLRDEGGLEYRDEIRWANLVSGERYVVGETINMCAHDDFVSTGTSVKSYRVRPGEVPENIPDFSAFDIGRKFLCLRIADSDNDYVNTEFEKLRTLPRDTSHKRLSKIKFRVHVEILDPSADRKVPLGPLQHWLDDLRAVRL